MVLRGKRDTTRIISWSIMFTTTIHVISRKIWITFRTVHGTRLFRNIAPKWGKIEARWRIRIQLNLHLFAGSGPVLFLRTHISILCLGYAHIGSQSFGSIFIESGSSKKSQSGSYYFLTLSEHKLKLLYNYKTFSSK